MTAPRRIGFKRLESDADLRARIHAQYPLAHQLSWETIEAFADRHGIERRIVEDAGAPEVRR